jgi:hypothetical protein
MRAGKGDGPIAALFAHLGDVGASRHRYCPGCQAATPPPTREFRFQGTPSLWCVPSGLTPARARSLATLRRKLMLLPVAVDIARADEPLELFWRQLLAGELPFQFSNNLVHLARCPSARQHYLS